MTANMLAVNDAFTILLALLMISMIINLYLFPRTTLLTSINSSTQSMHLDSASHSIVNSQLLAFYKLPPKQSLNLPAFTSPQFQ